MFTSNVKVSTTSDKKDQVKKSLAELKRLEVLVGIPQEKSSRQGEEINNAELAFIMTNGVRKKEVREEMNGDVQKFGYHKAHEMYIQANGSAIYGIPPRPIIEPAIEDDKANISKLLSEAAKAALDGDSELANKKLELAGLEGQGAAQDWFDNPKNGWDPNSEKTIKEKGSDKPLIDKGELRSAITYVIRKK